MKIPVYLLLAVLFITPHLTAYGNPTPTQGEPLKQASFETFKWIYSYRDTKLDITLQTDLGIVIKELKSAPRSSPKLTKSGWAPILQVVEQAGWGHAAPYLLRALYDSFGRLIYGISTSPQFTGIPLESREEYKFTFRVFKDQKTYNRYALDEYGSRPSGYWDPRGKELGLLVDDVLLRWLDYVVRTNASSYEHTIVAVENYFMQLINKQIGHEIVHLMQEGLEGPEFHIPLYIEGFCEYLADVLSTREESTRLSDIQFRINQAYGPSFSDVDFTGPKWPGSFSSVQRMRRVHETVNVDPAFSLSRMLEMSRDEFYRSDASTAQFLYDLSFSFVAFQAGKEASTLVKPIVEDIYRNGRITKSKSQSAKLDSRFRTWLNKRAEEWWLRNDADEKHHEALSAVTKTMQQRGMLVAAQHTVNMAAYSPTYEHLAMTYYVYRGDIFWRTQMNFDGFGYYLRAQQLISQRGGFVDFQTVSRIGDAYFQMGDMSHARESFSRVLAIPPKDFGMAGLIIHYRSRMKMLVLDLLVESGQNLTPVIIKQTDGLIPGLNQTLQKLSSNQSIDAWAKAELVYKQIETAMRANWQF